MAESATGRALAATAAPSRPSPLNGLSRPLWVLFGLCVVLALGLRLPQLDRRPMHNDEAVNALKFKQLWEQGKYRYDPNEHHGPTLDYFALALGRLTRGPDFDHYTEARLRLETVLFGLGLVLVLPLLDDALGRRATLWAALFTAVSPALVFYSRYFIHETLFVFFTLLALAAGWRYWRSRRFAWLALAAVALGLVIATKETFVITLGAAVCAVGLNQTWNRLLDASGPPVKAPPLKPAHLAAAFALCALVWAVFFSSFFTNPAGLLDSFRTFAPWISRAGGESPHVHPWYFYLHRLLWFHAGKGPVWTEAAVFVLALLGAASGFTRRRLGHGNASFVRFLACYTFLLTAFYSLLAYKTPWCLLSFWSGAVLLAGVGAAVLVRRARQWQGRAAWRLVLLAGAGYLGWQAWQLDTAYAADPRNPYVYAQTVPNLLELVGKIQAVTAASPDGRNTVIKVIAPEDDYWPLPWYLRSFKRVGWWNRIPSDPFAPIMVVSAQFNAQLDRTHTHLMVGYFELRPQVFLELYVQKDLWSAYLKQRPPQPEE